MTFTLTSHGGELKKNGYSYILGNVGPLFSYFDISVLNLPL